MSNEIKLTSLANLVGGTEGGDFVTVVIGEGENATEISVKKRLTLVERRDFVESVVEMCFVPTDGETNYCPYVRKFAFEYSVVRFFTNIDLLDDAEAAWKFIEVTNIADKINEAIGNDYIDQLYWEVDALVNYKKQKLLKNDTLSDFLKTITEIIKTVNEKLDADDGGMIMKYLEDNVPNFQDEIMKVVKEQKENTNM